MLKVRRREFITLLGGAAATWPVAARAQQPAMPVIGMLNGESADLSVNVVHAFQEGLREIGFVHGQNVVIEYRWAERQYDRLPALAADLVRRQVTLIAAPGSTPAALAAKAATTTIPVVFATGADPVQAGLVTSLNRPGGNVTGVATLNVEVAPKRLQLLYELIPTATTIALLVNPTNPALAGPASRDVEAAARTLGIKLHVLQASTERDFDTVLATAAQLRADGLVIGSDLLFNNWIGRLAALTVRQALPAVYQLHEFATAGGLLSYGSNSNDAYRQSGVYAGRILRGEKPANLPVQQTTKVELFINLKTAKRFGLTVPLPLLGRADEVIE
jgi:putative tryptophan/tyrosine transport system substrate-binding protein